MSEIGIEINIVLDAEKHKKKTMNKITHWLKKFMKHLNITGFVIK